MKIMTMNNLIFTIMKILLWRTW